MRRCLAGNVHKFSDVFADNHKTLQRGRHGLLLAAKHLWLSAESLWQSIGIDGRLQLESFRLPTSLKERAAEPNLNL